MNKLEQQQMYCKKIATHYEGLSKTTLEFVFSAFFPPNVWDDANSVYEIIADSFTFLEDEIPIVFIGGRHQSRITKKNQSLGFFLTDHTIYVQNASFFSDPQPNKYSYPTSIVQATQMLDKAIDSFEWEILENLFEGNTEEELKYLLLEIITDVLTLKKEFNIPHHEVKKATTIPGRLIDLNLTKESCIKLGSQEKETKYFSKVHKKLNIPLDEPIILAVTEGTFLGVYGLAITEKAVYSKDLMEKPTRTNRDDLSMNYPITLIEDSIRLSDEVVHILPNSLDEAEAVKTLIQEILNKELSV